MTTRLLFFEFNEPYIFSFIPALLSFMPFGEKHALIIRGINANFAIKIISINFLLYLHETQVYLFSIFADGTLLHVDVVGFL